MTAGITMQVVKKTDIFNVAWPSPKDAADSTMTICINMGIFMQ
jgi:hypothetical protein